MITMVLILELDLINAIALVLVLLILFAGLRCRQRAKRQLHQQQQQHQQPKDADSSIYSLLPNGQHHPRTPTAGDIGKSPGSSPKIPSTGITRGSPVCSGCQCSLTRCQCTIILYRPKRDVTPTLDNSVSGAIQGPPLLLNGVSSTALNSTLSSPVGATDRRRSPTRECVDPCRRIIAPSDDQYLTVERCRSRTSKSTTTVSGSEFNSTKPKGNGRNLETNANVVGFKSKMM